VGERVCASIGFVGVRAEETPSVGLFVAVTLRGWLTGRLAVRLTIRMAMRIGITVRYHKFFGFSGFLSPAPQEAQPCTSFERDGLSSRRFFHDTVTIGKIGTVIMMLCRCGSCAGSFPAMRWRWRCCELFACWLRWAEDLDFRSESYLEY
jgi:hypothetical protein